MSLSIQNSMLNGMGQTVMLGQLGAMNYNLNSINKSVEDINSTLLDANLRNELQAKDQLLHSLQSKLDDLDIKIAEYKTQGFDVGELLSVQEKIVERYNETVREYNARIEEIETQREKAEAIKKSKLKEQKILALVISILLLIGAVWFCFGIYSVGSKIGKHTVYAICTNCKTEYGYRISGICPTCKEHLLSQVNSDIYTPQNGYTYKRK